MCGIQQDTTSCPQLNFPKPDGVAVVVADRPLLRMDGSVDVDSGLPMNTIRFPDGTSSSVKMIGELPLAYKSGYPILISEHKLCNASITSIRAPERETRIPGYIYEIQEDPNRFAFSVIPLFLQDHRQCHDCPSINQVVKVVSEFWRESQDNATPEFERFVVALLSVFYNTGIRMGLGFGQYNGTLRRATLRDERLILFCDNEKHRDSECDPILEVEIRCESVLLSASGIYLVDDTHKLAQGLLCCHQTEPTLACHTVWKSSSSTQPHTINVLADRDRVMVTKTFSTGYPTPEWEKIRHILEDRLAYQREVLTPDEFEVLLTQIRRHEQQSRATPEQALRGAVNSIPYIKNARLRHIMMQKSRKIHQSQYPIPQPVREAICLQQIFLDPPQTFGEEEYESLNQKRQQNEANLIVEIERVWSKDVTKEESKPVLGFVLRMLALLQYFPARLYEYEDEASEQEEKSGYHSLAIQHSGVRLDFPRARSLSFEWMALERAFRDGEMAGQLGLKFDTLPDVFTKIPQFEGFYEKIFSPLSEKYWCGRVESKEDLSLLCQCFKTLPSAPPPADTTYVLMRPARPYKIQQDWVYQEYKYPFTTYATQSGSSISLGEWEFDYTSFFFKVVDLGGDNQTTPFQDHGKTSKISSPALSDPEAMPFPGSNTKFKHFPTYDHVSIMVEERQDQDYSFRHEHSQWIRSEHEKANHHNIVEKDAHMQDTDMV